MLSIYDICKKKLSTINGIFGVAVSNVGIYYDFFCVLQLVLYKECFPEVTANMMAAIDVADLRFKKRMNTRKNYSKQSLFILNE